MEDIVKELTIEYLLQTPLGTNLEKGLHAIESVQEGVVELAELKDADQLTRIKAGTVLTLALLKKMKDGKDIRKLPLDEWKEIADAVSDYAVKMDGQEYSAFVFLLYAQYIEESAECLKKRVSEEKTEKVLGLAEEIRTKTEQLRQGTIAEVPYTEDCLWICLDAMVKLLSLYAGSYTGEQAAEFIENASALAFEYGRYTLYKQEQELVAEYLRKQKVINEELKQKLEAYNKLLQEKEQQFRVLIKDAFAPEARKNMISSVQLARAAGVDEKQILDTVEKVDEFFLG